MASTILSDNGVSSGSAGLKTSADSTGVLALQTTTAGGTATTAITVDASQNTTFAGKVTSAGALTLASNGTTTALTITTAQNVGIGTTTPLALGNFVSLEVKGSSAGLVAVSSGAGSAFGRMYNAGSSVVLGASTAHPLLFDTNDTERMRIESSGNLLVGTTSSDISAVGIRLMNNNQLQASKSGDWSFRMGRRDSTGIVTEIYYNSSRVGDIATNGTGTSYNSASDYRLKENVEPMTGALAKVAALNPVTYRWKVDGSDGQGFIAHELAEVVPDAVRGTKDEIDADGKPVYQGIDTSFLVATLTAALQETKALLDTQAETINALTARIVALEGQ